MCRITTREQHCARGSLCCPSNTTAWKKNTRVLGLPVPSAAVGRHQGPRGLLQLGGVLSFCGPPLGSGASWVKTSPTEGWSRYTQDPLRVRLGLQGLSNLTAGGDWVAAQLPSGVLAPHALMDTRVSFWRSLWTRCSSTWSNHGPPLGEAVPPNLTPPGVTFDIHASVESPVKYV